MPRRFFTSGRKFSTTTSALAAIFFKTATPSGDFRFSVIERLLRCRFWKSEPSRGPPMPSPSAMCSGISILMQFAPQSASWRTQVGPARTRVRSRTVKRCSAVEARGNDISGRVRQVVGGPTIPDMAPVCLQPETHSTSALILRFRIAQAPNVWNLCSAYSRHRNFSGITLEQPLHTFITTLSAVMSDQKFPSALEIRGLTKPSDRPAVNGLDLTVRAGEFYSLLGPNGAGKTTTLRIVAGLLPPDAGAIHICGIDALGDPVEAKRIVAWVSDEPMIYDKLTPFEYLEFVAGLWSLDAEVAETRARELMEWLGLTPHAHERCEGFSKGMRQKVALAGALVHGPRVIILDEPLTGLDAGSARQVKRVLRERVAAGGTVIMTTHILEVAERMADRVGIIAGGRLIAEGTLDELRAQAGRDLTSLEDTFLALVAEQQAAA